MIYTIRKISKKQLAQYGEYAEWQVLVGYMAGNEQVASEDAAALQADSDGDEIYEPVEVPS